MTRWILPALLGLSLAGCQIIEPRYPAGERERVEVIERGTEAPREMETPRETERADHPATTGRAARQVAFPSEEYATLEKNGSAEISGRLLLGGRPVANRPVSAAPVTTYSAEAAEQALAGRAVEPADPRAREYTHTTRTDGNGYFRLGGLPAGEFYVSGSGQDPSTGKTRVLIRQVSLSNGQSRSIELSR
ncbi:carboxypeptidase-like regulatory domain-containing protein [Halomonas rhizosphaerae]|uniref:Carboxypeptidase-like regulatory domain-containing protein n=1 Tax=Halomonas rhizosphaerae TaxID=3043296 RepID=A0ABT6UZQ2_9GAMM|nr:carboxypeptidase-like regulatory domain-containing protein [Halomonas rhizosphaerae]MDI5891411.1 carboxypeptidase-like regulatory domain-containing protein [Halomonas rhizosphaerae]